MNDMMMPNDSRSVHLDVLEKKQDLTYLLTVGSPSDDSQQFRQKLGRMSKLLRFLQITFLWYLLLFGSTGIISRIDLVVAPLPPFAIFSFFMIIFLILLYSSLSIIRHGSVDILILIMIGSISVVGFENPFIQAFNFFLTYVLNDIGKITQYCLRMMKNYATYLETFEVERLYLTMSHLLKSSARKNLIILVLGMLPLVISALIEFDIGYRTTLLYPLLIFVGLMVFFLTKMGLSKKLLELFFNQDLQ